VLNWREKIKKNHWLIKYVILIIYSIISWILIIYKSFPDTCLSIAWFSYVMFIWSLSGLCKAYAFLVCSITHLSSRVHLYLSSLVFRLHLTRCIWLLVHWFLLSISFLLSSKCIWEICLNVHLRLNRLIVRN